MRVADLMTREVRVISPERSIREAARLMDDLNVGVLPVCDGRRLVGMVTDRDITVRATAAGLPPDDTQVREVMSHDVRWCFADASAEDVARTMSEMQIRRLPVVDRERRLVGIVALGDLAADRAPGADEALRRISTPAAPDRSATPSRARADRTLNRRPSPLTEDERRELERRMSRPDRTRGLEERPDPRGGDRRRDRDLDDAARLKDEFGFVGAGYEEFGFERGQGDDDGEYGNFGNFVSYDQGSMRGDLGGFDAGGGGGARMRGGFGGEGYSGYGVELGGGGGGGGYVGKADYGSYPDGSPRDRGLGGADDDRGIQSDRRGLQAERRGERALFRGGGGRIPELGDDPGHRGRGPKGYQRSDARIREDVSDVLADDPHLDASHIDVAVENGEVRLSGRVASRGDRRHAEDLAESVRGVRHVQNDLRAEWMAGGSGATTFGNATADLSDDGREPVVASGTPPAEGVSATSGTTGTSGASGRTGRGGTRRNAALPTGRTDDTDSTR